MKFSLILSALLACTGMLRAEQFQQDVGQLTRHPHRLTGSPEMLEASEYVKKRLIEIGVEDVMVQEFPFAQTAVRRCELLLNGQELPLTPMRANWVMAPVSPAAGIRGELLHAGLGRPQDYGDRSPKGKIVVLDYNSGSTWLEAFRRGARAVIFVAASPIEAGQVHWVANNANLPRFYFEGEPSALQEGAEAVIHSDIVWESVIGRNVLGMIRGTDPTFRMGREETLVLAAPLDSYGEAPLRSPGARGAANAAALLQIAEHLAENPPRRNVLLAFFDGQSRGHAGVSAFYTALEEEGPVQATLRLERTNEEHSFLAELEQGFHQDNPAEALSRPLRRDLMQRLRIAGAAISGEVTDELYSLRREQRGLDAEEQVAERALLEEKISRLGERNDGWNEVRRAIGADQLGLADPELLGELYAFVHHEVRLRLAELEIERRNLATDLRVRELLGSQFITLHSSLLLGDASTRWGLVIGGDSTLRSLKDNPGLYGRIQGLFLRAWQQLEEKGGAPAGFEIATADGSLFPPRLAWAAPHLIHSGEGAGKFSIYNLAFGTMQERLPREGTPADTLAHLDLEAIRTQAREVATLLGEAAGDPALSQPSAIERDRSYQLDKSAMGRRQGNPMPNRPMPDTTVQLLPVFTGSTVYQSHKPTAFDDFIVVRTNRKGRYSYGPLQADIAGPRGFAIATNERGAPVASSDLASFSTPATRLNMFFGRHGQAALATAVGGKPHTTWDIAAAATTVMDAASDGVLDRTKSFHSTLDGVVAWFVEHRIGAVKLFELGTIAALGIHDPATEEEAVEWADAMTRETAGRGLDMREPWQPPDSVARSSEDLYRLNESRISILRGRGILSSYVEELHGRSHDLLLEAAGAEDVLHRSSLQTSSFMASRPVYRDTRKMLDDLVRAVLILLALAVPFAFALERLLLGSTSIYKQIMGFVGFFLVTFLLLYFTHPAFAISNAPIIIFLGFALVVLSSLVIFIIMQKFEVELKVLQGMTSTVHAADVSRFGTIMAAMGMGISTMRRRPLRTALTAITIILLTFTILGFASFGAHTDVVRLYSMPAPPYAGAMVRQVNWSALSEDMLGLIRGRWGGQATVAPRYWISPDLQRKHGFLASRADGTQPVALRGLLGIDPAELTHRPDLAALLGSDEAAMADRAWITRAVAARMQVTPGDTILVSGVPLEVGPLLDPVAVGSVFDMDGSGILPVDFVEATGSQQAAQPTDDTMAGDDRTWSSLPVDGVVITSASAAASMGAKLHSIGIYTPDVASAVSITENLARLLPLPVAGTRSEGVFRHMLGPVLQASGVADLFFPILLGGMVIFGTMLGSVSDREKEIYTFSAIGLAPQHVAGLFFAEAMVFSVIGGMGGYLTAQAAMGLVQWLAGFGLMRVPEMNYSSTHAIVTILIVMVTVLISAIYPAIKASKSANPGVLRAWRLPKAEGDVLQMRFPFTVSAHDITGVVSFLKEHFDNFSDTGLGHFMAQRTELLIEGSERLGLKSHLALAPFDLGVTQDFELRSVPSEIPGIDEVNIRLERRSGEPRDWERLNKVLLDDLRKQFLIWRSLPVETMEIYRQRTLAKMGAANNEETVSHA